MRLTRNKKDKIMSSVNSGFAASQSFEEIRDTKTRIFFKEGINLSTSLSSLHLLSNIYHEINR